MRKDYFIIRDQCNMSGCTVTMSSTNCNTFDIERNMSALRLGLGHVYRGMDLIMQKTDTIGRTKFNSTENWRKQQTFLNEAITDVHRNGGDTRHTDPM